jgi:Holliday junction resolvasome RuvABC ATP-dependent DNA helicase subunit
MDKSPEKTKSKPSACISKVYARRRTCTRITNQIVKRIMIFQKYSTKEQIERAKQSASIEGE